MIQAKKMGFDYIRRDEEGNVEEIQRALDDINIEIKAGDFVAVLGKNGSGKSTFSKHLNALLMPTDGTLYVDGMDTSKQELVWKVRQNTGMVFQNPDNQIVSNIVEEDVGFGPENLGIPTEEIWKRVEESLSAVDMLAYRKESPNRLSGGQKQRVAIASVMAMHTKCIVFDEATAMLDPIGRKEVLETAHRLNKEENITVIWITHYMEEVVDADYIYLIDEGKVALEGTPRQVFTDVEQIRRYGLDVPQVTELAYVLRQEGMRLPPVVLTEEELIRCLEKEL
ncbi:MAG: energy-coupling factor transporter ATPase [Lachnospiraceae bacterium]|nr:energy-coupling factor transporter ATPase [Lachnospiraceae bacterium]